jgi:hypothetical protein
MNALTTRQQEALPHLVSAPNYVEGCRRAGITRTTFYKWLRNPSFEAELTKRKDAIVTEALDILKAHIGKAVDALVELLENTKNEGLRRQTANDIISYVLKLKELKDIEGRLDAIEKTLSELKTVHH